MATNETILEHGYSPYIGENGHWYVYDQVNQVFIDTNVAGIAEQGTTPSDLHTYSGDYERLLNKPYIPQNIKDGAGEGAVVINDVENNVASGNKAIAEGTTTIASGLNSHAMGKDTKATKDNQLVIGTYNHIDENNQAANAPFIIGGGDIQTENEGKDIFSVDWDGNVSANGTIKGTNITSKGSATQPVYFDANGVAQETTYPLQMNTVSQAGIVSAPTSSKPYYVYDTNANGAPQWESFNGVTSYNGIFDSDSRFNKNFKYVSPTNKYSYANRRCYFSFNQTTKSEYTNMPPVLNAITSGSVMGFREVLFLSSNFLMVNVIEMYPVAGRIHSICLNNGSWGSWYCTHPGEIQLIHTAVSLNGTSIGAHQGASKTVTATIPSGYTVVNHTTCWTTGVVGLMAQFDAYRTDATASIWLNNTQDNTMTLTANHYLHVLTLIRPS